MKIRAIPTLLRLTLSRHSDGVVNSVSVAWDLAVLRGHAYVTPEHLLAGIIQASERRPRTILHRMGFQIDPGAITELTGTALLGKAGEKIRFDDVNPRCYWRAPGINRGHWAILTSVQNTSSSRFCSGQPGRLQIGSESTRSRPKLSDDQPSIPPDPTKGFPLRD